ncbi:MAG: sulfide/dihydroorotate dehydrogenase-like FAD/NAD-binding protein [Flavonifractor plautii]
MKQQYQIVKKKVLTPEISQISVHAPLVAAKAKAGQFIILRVDENGERIPLTISSADQRTGPSPSSSRRKRHDPGPGSAERGDCLHDFVGPPGEATHEDLGLRLPGGGLGCAIARRWPCPARAGNQVDLIGGFKTKDIVILEEEMSHACTDLHICTDDGTYGYHGFVTGKLEELIQSGVKFDHVFAIGPLMMMKFACKLTEKYSIPTTVSMNPIMIDGTGMCGGCRLTVAAVKFACVDGPDFDGHQVDFDEVIARNATYREFEAERKRDHPCRLEVPSMANMQMTKTPMPERIPRSAANLLEVAQG